MFPEIAGVNFYTAVVFRGCRKQFSVGNPYADTNFQSMMPLRPASVTRECSRDICGSLDVRCLKIIGMAIDRNIVDCTRIEACPNIRFGAGKFVHDVPSVPCSVLS